MSRALLPFQVQRNKMERGEYDHVAPDPNLVTVKTEEVWIDDDVDDEEDPEATPRMAERLRVRNMSGVDFFRKMQEEFAKKKEREQLEKEEEMKDASDAVGRESEDKNNNDDNDPLDPDAAGFKIRQSREERKAREMGIPISLNEIVNLPLEKFNDMLSRHELNEEQLAFCRDMWRRGKKGQELLRLSRHRLSRMTMKTNFDQLKYQLLELGVPRLSLATKEAILNKAVEFARLLEQTDLELTNERKRLARKNAELRQILESDKMEYFEAQNKEFEYIIYEI